ncbi:MAG: GtrA family protein [Solobacterium sp.]|nr:GtrA family protein [Solobacterium sp.]
MNRQLTEILRYGIGGLTVTLLNIGIYLFFNALQFDYRISNLIALTVSKVSAYFINKYYVFRVRHTDRKEDAGKLLRYILSRGMTAVLDYVLLIIFVEILMINKTTAKYIVQAVVILVNYLLSKWYIFRQS